MTHEAVHDAVQAVCAEDGMGETYASALEALIENAMLDSLDPSDIYDILDMVDVEEPTDED